MTVVQVLAGLGLLVLGGEVLVRGATSVARRLGMSALVVGLTVVSVATSAPELAVTADAVAQGSTELAVGNVVGSNTANVLLVIGAAAMLRPIPAPPRLVRFDLPAVIVISLVVWLLGRDGRLDRLDGGILLAGYLTHLGLALWRAKSQPSDQPPETTADPAPPGVWRSAGQVVIGVGLLVAGAHVLVQAAVAIATSLGVSGLVVGLTVVAVGTSLPELAASVSAARRGTGELALGNAVGSNIANLGLVLAVPALFAAGGLVVPPGAASIDLPLMIAAAVVLVPAALSHARLSRSEGVVFVGLYLAYLTYIVLTAREHPALDGYTTVMTWFVLPLVLATGLLRLVSSHRGRT